MAGTPGVNCAIIHFGYGFKSKRMSLMQTQTAIQDLGCIVVIVAY